MRGWAKGRELGWGLREAGDVGEMGVGFGVMIDHVRCERRISLC